MKKGMFIGILGLVLLLSLSFVCVADALPDLIIENISIEYWSVGGFDNVPEYIIHVKNIGDSPANLSSLWVEVSPAQPQSLDIDGKLFFKKSSSITFPIPMHDLFFGVLMPGESERADSYFNPSGDMQVTISASADDYDEVIESNESNNYMSAVFSINKTLTLNSCEDSDDWNVYSRGNVTQSYDDVESFVEDFCNDASLLTEYLCDEEFLLSSWEYCEKGCEEGACIGAGELSAITFDGDINDWFTAYRTWESYIMRATEFSVNNSVNEVTIQYNSGFGFIDAGHNHILDWMNVKEDVHQGDTVILGNIILSIGEINVEEKTVDISAVNFETVLTLGEGELSDCTETDFGYDPYRKGIATGVFGGLVGSFSDSCCSGDSCDSIEGDRVFETYCDGYFIRTAQADCDNGCYDGICVGECGDDTCQEIYASPSERGFFARIWFWIIGLFGREVLPSPIYEENCSSCPQDCGVCGADVKLEFSYFQDYYVRERAGTVYAYLSNYGGYDSEVNVSLYEDNSLVESQFFEVEARGGNGVVFNWIPKQIGKVNLMIIVNASDDVNLSDNSYSKEVDVYNSKNITINVVNSTNNALYDRVIYTEAGGEAGYSHSQPIKVLDGGKNMMGIVRFSSGDNPGDMDLLASVGGFGTFYLNSTPEDNGTIISEYYSNVTDNNKTYYGVFANKPSFNYENSVAFISINKSALSFIGVDTEDIVDYVLVYCTSFDFISKKCNSGWTAEGAYYDVDFISSSSSWDIYAIAAFNLPKIEAAALTKSYFIITDNMIDFVGKGSITFLNSSVNLSGMTSEDASRAVEFWSVPKFKVGLGIYWYDSLNVSARILFKNVYLNNPKILYDGQTCSSSICTNISYNTTTHTFVFDVPHFSSYEVVEGAYCGNGIVDAGETCDNCESDVGDCEGDDEGDDDDDSGNAECRTRWNCTWMPCVNHIQRQICTDLNGCNSLSGKPREQTRACLVSSNCIDNDGDGYGIGSDCLGEDLNDNNSSITDFLGGQQQESKGVFGRVLLVTFIVILAVILFLVVLSFILKKKK